MKKVFLTLAVFVMAICANAQTNQYFWYNGNLMMGNPIAQIDSVTFGEGEPVDTLHIMLPRTIIKTVHDTVIKIVHDTVCPNDIPEGALAGEFSVSATKKVRFSKGNLQYQASTDTWRFAENQYDYIGKANENISSTYSGWLDYFCWGTGNNPLLYSLDVSVYSFFTEWGNNLNINNSNYHWRTLTKDEWQYLFSGRPDAETLCGNAQINNINGFIFLPDNFIAPQNIIFHPQASSYNSNIYSIEEWQELEKVGALFLPAAGGRNSESTYSYNVNQFGHYWSATVSETSGEAYQIDYWEPEFKIRSYPVNTGQSVRLVLDIQ